MTTSKYAHDLFENLGDLSDRFNSRIGFSLSDMGIIVKDDEEISVELKISAKKAKEIVDHICHLADFHDERIDEENDNQYVKDAAFDIINEAGYVLWGDGNEMSFA